MSISVSISRWCCFVFSHTQISFTRDISTFTVFCCPIFHLYLLRNNFSPATLLDSFYVFLSLRRLNKYNKKSTKEMKRKFHRLSCLGRNSIEFIKFIDFWVLWVRILNIRSAMNILLLVRMLVIQFELFVPIKFPLNFRWKMRNLLPDFLYVYKTFPLTRVEKFFDDEEETGQSSKGFHN